VQLSFAQEKTISGTVTDDSGLPLPGVNIIVKNTTNGTQSDFDGNYSISSAVGQTLVFSYVGFDSQEMPIVASSSKMNVTMAQGETLDAVVLTGYGGVTKERKSLGYAVTTLEADAIENKPESDVVRSLNGKVAGVQIVGNSGATGSGTNFVIRGRSSINGSNQPLFIVDGVPFDSGTNQQTGFAGGNTVTSSRFLDLDPNNVESVQILKGLSASVLYGQQGRNGVVLITTKNGSNKDLNKKFEVTVNSSVYQTQISNLADYQNQYGQGSDNTPNAGFVGNWGGRLDAGLQIAHPYASQGAIFPEFDDLEIPYVAAENNVKDFFRTGLGQAMSVNVAGSPGSDGNTRYNLNFGYTTEDGYIRNNGLTRYNIGLGGSTKLSNKFSFDGTANFSSTRVNTPPIAANNAGGALSIFTRTLFIPRNLDLNNLPFENPNDGSNVYYRTDQENPYWLLNYAGSEQKTNRFFGKLGAAYEISDNTTVSYRFGLDTYNENQEFRVARGGVTVPYDTGYLRTTSGTNFIYDHNLNFSFNNIVLAENLSLTTQLGFNARRDTYEQFGQSSQNQVVFGFFNHSNFIDQQANDPVSGGLAFRAEQNILGAYGEASFDYNGFLYLTLSGRNDWASTLEQENRSLFYPGASISFVPTSIDGVGSASGLGFLKLRAGYGTSARFPGPYSTRTAFNSNAEAVINPLGNAVTTNGLSTFLGNVDLQPELQKEFELGLESELFNKRIRLDATVYRRTIEDQIVNRPISPSSGAIFTSDNIAETQIQGVELGLDFTLLKSENFTWDVRNNFSAFENEVIDLGGVEEFAYAGFTNLGNFASEGEALGVIKGSYAARYAPENIGDDNPYGVGVEGVLLIDPTDGSIIDSEGDLGLDIETIGDPNPDWTVTTINTFTYKQVSLSAQLEYTHGGDIFSQTATQYYRRGVTTANVDNREGSYVIPGLLANPATGQLVLNDAGQPIENTIQIGANDVYFINLVDPSGQGIYDASHMRLREATLTYSLTEGMLEKTPFGNVSFSLSGQNLYVKAFNIPEAFNIDPEALSTGTGNGQGLEFQTGPTSRRYSFGIKATF
jgi:TonB-linked SusC/RagA family outer membrane protein